jgi:ubiquinone/menaquinone biosynthesis C-methylase UbiE
MASAPRLRFQLEYVVKSAGRRLIWGTSELARPEKSEGLSPPRRLSYVGRGDFARVGEEFLGHFRELGGLAPGDDVLDVGCGIGRMAIPLTAYLDGGSYRGFDVGKEMIRWCQRNVTPRHPSFEFAWAPVYNSKYNPFGDLDGAGFRFPYDDDSFDFAFATSLFTHLQPREIRHYLAEAARVLRPGGRCLFTFFLLDPEVERRLAAGETSIAFTHPLGSARVADPRRPEEAIAYPQEEIVAMFEAVGLPLRGPVHNGYWGTPGGGPSAQDIVVAARLGEI